jgi:hypothetical protein
MLKARSSLRVFRIAVAAAVGVLLLAGCTNANELTDAGSSPTRSASPSATPAATAPLASASPAPTPSATPTAPPVDIDDPNTWTIEFTTLGPLTRGTPASEATPSMTAFTTVVQEGCTWITGYDKPEFPSIWLVATQESEVSAQIVLQKWGGAAPVAPNSPRTLEGIGIGSTDDELTTAYPTISVVEGTYGPHYSLTDGAGNYLNFDITDEGLIDTIVLDTKPDMAGEYCG